MKEKEEEEEKKKNIFSFGNVLNRQSGLSKGSSMSCLLGPMIRARIFKCLWGPGIDSKDSIPPAYVAWRAGTITLFFLGS
jgi:hypothetical protein